jgi:hypothetical protein
MHDTTGTTADLNEVTNAGWNKAVVVGANGVILTKVFPDAPTGVDEPVAARASYALLGNYPNPFNGETVIRYRPGADSGGQDRRGGSAREVGRRVVPGCAGGRGEHRAI